MNFIDYVDLYRSLLDRADDIRSASDAESAGVIARRLVDAAHEKIDGEMPNGATMILGMATFILSMSKLGKEGIFKNVDDSQLQFCMMLHVICASAIIKMMDRGENTLQ